MAQRDRELADERGVGGVEQIAFDIVAADRIRPIAHDNAHAVACRGPHAVGHRVDVGVDPRADILQIDDEHIEIAQHVGAGLARFAVERIDRHPPPAVARMGRLDHVVLHVGAKPVLRAEERRHGDVRIIGQPIGRMPEIAVDGRGVAHDPDAAPGNERAVDVEESIDSEGEGGGYLGGRGHAGDYRPWLARRAATSSRARNAARNASLNELQRKR